MWGPVSASPSGPNWLGARRATSSTGELSAIYHALDWIKKRHKSLDPATSPCYNIVSDSDNCVKFLQLVPLNQFLTGTSPLGSTSSLSW